MWFSRIERRQSTPILRVCVPWMRSTLLASPFFARSPLTIIHLEQHFWYRSSDGVGDGNEWCEYWITFTAIGIPHIHRRTIIMVSRPISSNLLNLAICDMRPNTIWTTKITWYVKNAFDAHGYLRFVVKNYILPIIIGNDFLGTILRTATRTAWAREQWQQR